MGADVFAPGSGAAFRLGNRPFARPEEVITGVAPAGLTVAEIVDALVSDGLLAADLRSFAHVQIGHSDVPRTMWHRVRPKSPARLTVRILPKGGGGGGSSPVRIIATLAIVALAAYTGGAALSALSAAGFSAGVAATGAALASAAVAVGGNLLLNAVVPIKQPDQQARKARYSLTGASNQARPHDPVPVILGRRRTFPPRCANPYTVMVGQDVYLRCMMQPSLGWVDREDVRIGETPIGGFDGVTLNWHTRPDDATTPLWFDRVVAEDPIGVPVKNAAGWLTRAAPIAATTLQVDLGFQAGLYEIKKSSGQPTKSRTVQVEVRYGPRGGSPETATPAPIGSAGVVTYTMAVADAWRETKAWSVPAGDYDVHVRRITGDQPDGQTTVSDLLSWVCIRAFGADAPLADPANTPWVEIEVKASDQLNGVLDTFNFVATSVVREATATGPGATWIASRNPADLFLAASLAPFSDLELDDDERNLTEIATWRALCADEGWNCDLAEDQEQSVGELLLRVATCGLARPTLAGGALSVVVDWAKPEGYQIFTARNVAKFRGSVVYPTETHGLRLRFQNAAKGYDDDTVVVYAAGYDASSASLYDSLDIRDKCDSAEVEALGVRILAQRILRPETFVFEQDVEYVVVREGDRALLAHPVALVGQVAARIQEAVTRNGGLDHGVRLDEQVVMEAGKSYALAWRSTQDLALRTSALVTEAGESDKVWFASSSSGLPDVGDLAQLGEATIETVEVIVNRISPKAGLKAEIECVPYAPELQSLDPGEVVIYRSGASRPPALQGVGLSGTPDLDRRIASLTALLAEAASSALAAVSDGVITVAEKRELVPRLKALLANAADLSIAGGASAQRTTYVDALADLQDALATLTDPVAWDDVSDDTLVPDPEAFRSVLQAFIAAETALVATLSTWGGLTGDGKPEDHATVGATAGVNIKGPGGTIAAVEDILNRFLSLGFDGTTLNLLRASATGGGPVSISSLVMSALNSVAASQLLPDLRRPIEDTFVASILAMGEADQLAFAQGKSNTIVFSTLKQSKDDTTAAVSKMDGIAARVGTNEAAITTLQATSATLNSSVATLTASVSAQAAGLAAANTTIAANSSAIGSLNSTVSSISSTVSAQGTAITGLSSGLAAANTNISANTTSIGSLTTSVSSLSSTVSAQASTLSSQGSDIGTLNTFKASASTTLSAHASSLGTLSASYTVRLNVNGRVSGFGLADGTGGTSEFAVLASRFLVIDPSDDGNASHPFEVVDGVVKMKNALIGTLAAANLAAGIITYDKLVPNTLTAGEFATGALGESAAAYSHASVTIGTGWTDVAALNLSPAQGAPIYGTFGGTATIAANNFVAVRVVRDDGVVIFDEAGVPSTDASGGTGTIAVSFFDQVSQGRSTTYTLQAKQGGPGASAKNIAGWVQELSKLHFQTFSISR